MLLNLEYRHPNPEMAAKVANLFADEYLASRNPADPLTGQIVERATPPPPGAYVSPSFLGGLQRWLH
jgi:hypothetical protein